MPKHLYDCTVSYHTMNINVGNIGQLTIDSNMDCIPDWPNNQNRNNMVPPLIIESTNMVSNLNVEFLQGYTPNSFLKLINNNLGIGIPNPIEKLEVNGAIRLGNSRSEIDGTIRWTGNDFEGRKSGSWISLTQTNTISTNNTDISGIIDFGSRKIISDVERHLLLTSICHAVPNTIVKRDSNGNIAAGLIKSALLGSVVQAEQPNITSLGNLTSLKVGNMEFNDMNIAFGNNHKITIINDKFTFVKSGLIQNENGEMVAQYEEVGINFWQNEGNNIIRTNGNVGIGTNKPLDKLHITGGLILGNTWSNIDGTIRWNGRDFEGRMNNDWISLTQNNFNYNSIERWKDIIIAGQQPLIPTSMENLHIIPGAGITIKTNITNPKSIMISSTIKESQIQGITDDINTCYGLNAGKHSTGSHNVIIGNNSGYANTTGTENIFIGKNAGFSNIERSLNTFIGSNAGYTNQISQQCTYIGSYAGYSSNAHYNTFIGASAGQYVSLGERNVYIGMKAGRCNSKEKGTGFRNTLIGGFNGFNMTTGCENCSLGYGSNHSLTEGCLNISIGNKSGYTITTGNANILVGTEAGYNIKEGNNNIMIGHKAGYYLNNVNNKLIIANGPNKENVIIEGNLENKTLNIMGQLNINGIDIINELRKEIAELKEKLNTITSSSHN